MAARGLLAAFLVLAAGPAGAEVRWSLPSEVRPGTLAAVTAAEGEGAPPPAFRVVLTRDGKILARGRSFGAAPGLEAAFLAPEVSTLPGAADLTVEDLGGQRLAGRAVVVTDPGFHREEIALDGAMSALRSAPDPRKDAEARAIWALYESFRPEAPRALGRWQVPVAPGPRISGGFGDTRVYQYADGGQASDVHRGTDFAVPPGTPVFAPADGRVVLAARRVLTGVTVVVEHAPGLYSVYFHLSKASVRVGDLVVSGQRLAFSGATGLVTGPHLHWEVRYLGTPVDPLALTQGPLVDLPGIPPVDTQGPSR